MAFLDRNSETVLHTGVVVVPANASGAGSTPSTA